jgi:glycosyltransferase involved in cell wall biosynthesis
MRILLVSMRSIHFYRWVDQLKGQGHEILWFDIRSGGTIVPALEGIEQIVDWKLRWNFPARYWIKVKFPWLYNFLDRFNSRSLEKSVENVLDNFKPDLVHSFAIYVSCAPILNVMKRRPRLKWVFSSWGSDLFFMEKNREGLKEIEEVLERMNYMFNDCHRDKKIAIKNGFNGKSLGVYPGGGGYDLDACKAIELGHKKRKLILVKGYQARHGQAIPVLQAILKLALKLASFEIVFFGTDPEVIQFYKNLIRKSALNISFLGSISHDELLKLYGRALIYLGNSESDGMPNTLLEAICLGAYPVQSNPGGATEEIITDKLNGRLIHDPHSVADIAEIMEWVIEHKDEVEKGVEYNNAFLRPALSFKNIQSSVLAQYNRIEEEILKK